MSDDQYSPPVINLRFSKRSTLRFLASLQQKSTTKHIIRSFCYCAACFTIHCTDTHLKVTAQWQRKQLFSGINVVFHDFIVTKPPSIAYQVAVQWFFVNNYSPQLPSQQRKYTCSYQGTFPRSKLSVGRALPLPQPMVIFRLLQSPITRTSYFSSLTHRIFSFWSWVFVKSQVSGFFFFNGIERLLVGTVVCLPHS